MKETYWDAFINPLRSTLHNIISFVPRMLVAILNSAVFSNPVVNHTRLGQRRYTVDFDTSLTADAQTVERESLRAATENPDIAPAPAPFLRVHSADSDEPRRRVPGPLSSALLSNTSGLARQGFQRCCTSLV